METMNEIQVTQADRRARIAAALARYEDGKVKRHKRKSVKLFSLDEPQWERGETRKYE